MATYWVSLSVQLAVLVIVIAASTDLESRIQNGQSIGSEQKHLVQSNSQFYSNKKNEEVFECTGSTLNEYWIITAKHCLQRPGCNLIGAKVVRHMNNFFAEPNVMADYKLAPVNGPSTFAQNDIALMKVTNRLNTAVYQPIPMDINYPVEGSMAVVAGYGKPDPSIPRQGVVTIAKCARAPICSFSSGYMTRPDHGDKGGPLMVNGRLVAIISEGVPPTAGNPTYEEHFAAIADYYNWIMNVIHT